MERTGLGLLLNAWGAVMVMVILAFAIAIQIVDSSAFMKIQYTVLGGIAVGGILSLAGLFFCRAVPKQTGARKWIESTIAFCLVNVAVSGYVTYCAIQQIPMILPAWTINLISVALAIGTFICFMCFIKNVARSVAKPRWASTAVNAMWIQFIVLVAIGVLMLMMYMLPRNQMTVVLVRGLAIGILVTAMINQIMVLVVGFRLGNHLRRSATQIAK